MNIGQAVRFGFWIVLLATLVLTLSPRPIALPFLGDKAAHALSFFVLGLLGFVAWPNTVLVSLALIAIGGAIELLQATPLIARDSEFLDWIADIAGIAGALLVFALLAAAGVRRGKNGGRDAGGS